jgi:Ni2+-binding GTPase involved in maturation of urease and hydrogenase
MKKITITVEGPPKSGKTRLIEKFEKAADFLKMDTELVFIEKLTKRHAPDKIAV